MKEQIKMFYQGSIWTKSPDLNNSEELEISEILPCITNKPLSNRQIEILRLIGKGLLDKEIASELTISIHTVRGHKDRISEKYGIERKRQLAALAVKLQLI